MDTMTLLRRLTAAYPRISFYVKCEVHDLSARICFTWDGVEIIDPSKGPDGIVGSIHRYRIRGHDLVDILEHNAIIYMG